MTPAMHGAHSPSIDIDTLSLADYARFLARQDVGPVTLYHDPRWLRAVDEGLGMRTTVLGLQASGDLVGALPGFMVRKLGVRVFGAPLRGSMTPYLGWVLTRSTPVESRAVLGGVAAHCARRLGCHYAEIGMLEPPSDLPPEPPLDGWRSAQRETYMLDLRAGEAPLWSNLGQRTRGKVRKAAKSGVSIERVRERDFLDAFFPMVESSYARHRAVSPHPKRFYESLCLHLAPHGLMEMFAAKYEGRVIAGALVLHDGREARCMSNASLPEYHQMYPNNLLHWEIISWACAAGLERYDFGGKGDPGIDRFKETFHPSPYAYTFYWRASPPLALARSLVLGAWPKIQWCRYELRRLRGDGARFPGPAVPAE